MTIVTDSATDEEAETPAPRKVRGIRSRMAATPLRVRLVILLVALVAVALAAAGIAANAALRGYLVDRIDSQLVDAAHRFSDPRAAQLGIPGDDRNQPAPPSVYYVRYADATGDRTVVIGNALATGEEAPTLAKLTVAQVVAQGDEPYTVESPNGTQWRAVTVPLGDSSGTVTVAQSLAGVQSTVSRLALLEVTIGAVVLLLLGLLGYFLIRRSLRPLVEVEETAASIAAGDLTRRVPQSDSTTEVGRLATALNTMLSQIESSFHEREASEAAARESESRMRRFVADASHELRTPLTSIRGFSELYRQGAVANPDELARVMRRIEDEAARMGLLVDDLLLLARLDQQRPLVSLPVELRELVSDAVMDARAVSPDRSIDLVLADPEDPVVVTGDQSRLRQVLGNLMSNALSHTPAGTPVLVLLRSGDMATIEIRDQGPGLDPDAAERIFERFYRVDQSRSRGFATSSPSGGSGLGLSIVNALVVAHGGSVEVETAPGEGAAFRIMLPLLSSSTDASDPDTDAPDTRGPNTDAEAGSSAIDAAHADATRVNKPSVDLPPTD